MIDSSIALPDGRQLVVDWANDVEVLADVLQIDRFIELPIVASELVLGSQSPVA